MPKRAKQCTTKETDPIKAARKLKNNEAARRYRERKRRSLESKQRCWEALQRDHMTLFKKLCNKRKVQKWLKLLHDSPRKREYQIRLKKKISTQLQQQKQQQQKHSTSHNLNSSSSEYQSETANSLSPSTDDYGQYDIDEQYQPQYTSLCFNCPEPSNPTIQCKNCEIAKYCSINCRDNHWISHQGKPCNRLKILKNINLVKIPCSYSSEEQL